VVSDVQTEGAEQRQPPGLMPEDDKSDLDHRTPHHLSMSCFARCAGSTECFACNSPTKIPWNAREGGTLVPPSLITHFAGRASWTRTFMAG